MHLVHRQTALASEKLHVLFQADAAAHMQHSPGPTSMQQQMTMIATHLTPVGDLGLCVNSTEVQNMQGTEAAQGGQRRSHLQTARTQAGTDRCRAIGKGRARRALRTVSSTVTCTRQATSCQHCPRRDEGVQIGDLDMTSSRVT